MFHTILVAVDGSACADRALGIAIDLASHDSAHLSICTVVDPIPILGETGASSMASRALAESREDAQRLVDGALAKAQAAGVQAKGSIRFGEPAFEIGAQAAAVHADALALGTHGRSGLKRLFVGSVAEAVLRKSTIPVIIAPERAAHAHQAHA